MKHMKNTAVYKIYIEQMLQNFDKVIFLADNKNDNYIWKAIEKSAMSNRKILILSASLQDSDKKNIICKRISKKFAEQLNTLYKLYEFADNFILVEANSMYAMLFNYTRTGILTIEEMWQAILR